jgi:hypothetical protein
MRYRFDQLKISDQRKPNTANVCQARYRCGQDVIEIAEGLKQPAGNWLRVTAR